MAKAKAALAPLSSKLANDERAKHTKKTAADEWDTRPAQIAKNAAEVLAAIESVDREGIDVADPELIKRIWDTAREMYRKQTQIAKLEADLAEAIAEVKRLSETVLPELMSEAETKELTSDTGVKLKKADKVYANISKDNAPTAMKWLEAQGFGALIKASFAVPVDKGDTKLMKKIRALLIKAKLAFEEKAAVHPQTLTAFVRESIEKARALPASITYHIQPTVEIKLPKEKKPTDKFIADTNDISL